MQKDKKLIYLRNSIEHISDQDEESFFKLLVESKLLSLTEPVFFEFLDELLVSIKNTKIEGDIVEAGVWCGATSIYMKALIAHLQLNCDLWLMDVFSLPLDISKYQHEKDRDFLKKITSLAGFHTWGLQDVKANFEKFDLLDDRIKFIKGDVFNTYTLITAHSISVLRVDLDFYESTYFILDKLYSKVCSGGYIVIDDYGVKQLNCKEAVDQFRKDNNIKTPLVSVGKFISYWIKE